MGCIYLPDYAAKTRVEPDQTRPNRIVHSKFEPSPVDVLAGRHCPPYVSTALRYCIV